MATLLVTTVVLAGSAAPRRAHVPRVLAQAPSAGVRGDPLARGEALGVPAALTDGALDLRAGPVAVALELQMPSLGTRAPVAGVGITTKNVMDAPMGPAKDPVWQQAFWYRGSAVPGALSTALIAGHANDPLGRPAVFAHIDNLRPGDPIVVRDTRSGLSIHFSVTDSQTYSLAQSTEPTVLTQIYGAGPVRGIRPQPSADGLSHLTLITCAGTFRNGTHDRRFVVYATRTA